MSAKAKKITMLFVTCPECNAESAYDSVQVIGKFLFLTWICPICTSTVSSKPYKKTI